MTIISASGEGDAIAHIVGPAGMGPAGVGFITYPHLSVINQLGDKHWIWYGGLRWNKSGWFCFKG